jgi:hypothetical protein
MTEPKKDTKVVEMTNNNDRLVAAIQAEQGKLIQQLCAANPQWNRLQGMLDALEGKLKLNEEETK